MVASFPGLSFFIACAQAARTDCGTAGNELLQTIWSEAMGARLQPRCGDRFTSVIGQLLQNIHSFSHWIDVQSSPPHLQAPATA